MAKTYKGAPCDACGGDIRTKGIGHKCATCYPPHKEMGDAEKVAIRRRIEEHQHRNDNERG
jgi:hypothetical protein